MKIRLFSFLALTMFLILGPACAVSAREALPLTRTHVPEGAFYADLDPASMYTQHWVESRGDKSMPGFMVKSFLEEYGVTIQIDRMRAGQAIFDDDTGLSPAARTEIITELFVADAHLMDAATLAETVVNARPSRSEVIESNGRAYYTNVYAGTVGGGAYEVACSMMFFEGDVFYITVIYPAQFAGLLDLPTWLGSVEPLAYAEPAAPAPGPLGLTRTLIERGAFYADIHEASLTVEEDSWESLRTIKAIWGEYPVTYSICRYFDHEALLALDPDLSPAEEEAFFLDFMREAHYEAPETDSDGATLLRKEIYDFNGRRFYTTFYQDDPSRSELIFVESFMYFEGDIFEILAAYPAQYENLAELAAVLRSIEPLSLTAGAPAETGGWSVTRTLIEEGAFYVDLRPSSLLVNDEAGSARREPRSVFASWEIAEYDITFIVGRYFDHEFNLAREPGLTPDDEQLLFLAFIVDTLYEEPEDGETTLLRSEVADYNGRRYYTKFLAGVWRDQAYKFFVSQMYFEGDTFQIIVSCPARYGHLVDLPALLGSIEPLSVLPAASAPGARISKKGN